MDVTTPEFDFTEYLSVVALKNTTLTQVKIEPNSATNEHAVHFYSDVCQDRSYKLNFAARKDENRELYRIHVSTVEVTASELGSLYRLLNEHDIPVRELATTALNDGVLLACITSNINKIEAAFKNKEVHW